MWKFERVMLCFFYTGWTDAKLKSEPGVWVSTIPGITNEAAVYLASKDPMAVGADTLGDRRCPTDRR